MQACRVRVSVAGDRWRRFAARCRERCPRAVRAAIDVHRRWASSPGGLAEVSILLTDDADLRRWNRRYRGIDRRTNVLAFAGGESHPAIPHCGDLALGAQIIQEEAVSRRTSVADHVTHLVVHGTLHLLGHTHDTPDDGARMERMETAALESLGIADPYRDEVKDGPLSTL